MGKLSRTKGHSFERKVAALFREIYPRARRQLEYHPDDALGVDIQDCGPFLIQCKRGRKYHSLSAIEEVQTRPGGIPALITKGDDKEEIIALYLKDFLDIIKKLENITRCKSLGLD
jgi:hypothetical protein